MIIYEEKIWFELLQGNVLEVGLHEGDFGVGLHESDFDMVLGECLRAILKVQLALYQENPEFVGISPVKLVQFSDFCVLCRGVVMQGLG